MIATRIELGTIDVGRWLSLKSEESIRTVMNRAWTKPQAITCRFLLPSLKPLGLQCLRLRLLLQSAVTAQQTSDESI